QAVPADAPADASRPDPEATDYIETVRAVEARQPGALAHLKVLADGGWAPAQVYLARLYEMGQAGVIQNLAEASRWTARAANAGDAEARASAVELQAKLPATQLAAAETQANAFEPTAGGRAVAETQASGLSVTAAQKVLGRLGYYQGRPDGAVSPQLKLAVT